MGNVVTKATYEGNGTLNTFTIPFDYLSRTHVHVYINNVEITEGFTWATAYSLQFTTPPAIGAIIKIERNTPVDENFISWKDGTVIIAGDLNAQGLQGLYIDQERQKDIDLIRSYFLNDEGETVFKNNMAEFNNLLTNSPISFGRFRVSANGDLIMEYFGSIVKDDCAINTNGELVITVAD